MVWDLLGDTESPDAHCGRSAMEEGPDWSYADTRPARFDPLVINWASADTAALKPLISPHNSINLDFIAVLFYRLP